MEPSAAADGISPKVAEKLRQLQVAKPKLLALLGRLRQAGAKLDPDLFNLMQRQAFAAIGVVFSKERNIGRQLGDLAKNELGARRVGRKVCVCVYALLLAGSTCACAMFVILALPPLLFARAPSPPCLSAAAFFSLPVERRQHHRAKHSFCNPHWLHQRVPYSLARAPSVRRTNKGGATSHCPHYVITHPSFCF